jgi:hypothetical protein
MTVEDGRIILEVRKIEVWDVLHPKFDFGRDPRCQNTLNSGHPILEVEKARMLEIAPIRCPGQPGDRFFDPKWKDQKRS